jgi:hypothetical protein
MCSQTLELTELLNYLIQKPSTFSEDYDYESIALYHK